MPQHKGLYRHDMEHDACGVGMVVNIHGSKSHELVDQALHVLENMQHRGAEGADKKTGDGAGIMIQIPHEFILLQGIPMPEKGHYGTGLVFMPKDEEAQRQILTVMTEEVEREGLTLSHVRTVPTNPECLGQVARESEPVIVQVFITGGEPSSLARTLYKIRKRIERRVTDKDFYICSLSNTNLVYKGMLTSKQLRQYFPDLSSPYLTSGLALVHSRFSTNTFPTWSLAQPFRLLAHNGEINTIRGNRSWMQAREKVMLGAANPAGLPADIAPIIEPDMSDSASLDNALEFLMMSGLSLPHAMSVLVPESFNDKNPISAELKAFYEYHSILMEPWDGPAALLFSDGRFAGGMLDRNGLRPSRYTITRSGMMVVASEVGVMDFEPADVVAKGRLQPGKILLVDTQEGRIYYDGEIKQQLAAAHPYGEWLHTNRIQLEKLKSGRKMENTVEDFERKLRLFDYGQEDIDRTIIPMAVGGQEPVAAMGNDTPLAVLSDRPQLLFNYFRQQFAQVTNPAIDPIREELVMSLTEYIGCVGTGILTPDASNCKMVRLPQPVLTNTQLDLLCNIRYKGFKTQKLSLAFKAENGAKGLHESLDKLCRQAENSVDEGVNYVILSDRKIADGEAAIPSLLAVSAVHHHLIRVGKRVQTALIVESGEIRETMHAALLLGYGASALCPYMTFAILDDLVKKGKIQEDYATAEAHYIQAVDKGLKKIMSKMGISTIRSYRGAKIFESIGLGEDLLRRYFGTQVSTIGGIGLEEIARDAVLRMTSYELRMTNDELRMTNDELRITNDELRMTNTSNSPASKDNLIRHSERSEIRHSSFHGEAAHSSFLPNHGQFSWRRDGIQHAWNPETIAKLQLACRTGDYEKYKEWERLVDEKEKPIFLRDLLTFKRPFPNPSPREGSRPTPSPSPREGSSMPLDSRGNESPSLGEGLGVGQLSSILSHFVTGAMSFGALSKEAHEALALAMNRLGARSNTGEGGEDSERFHKEVDGISLSSKTKQVASGRFGVTTEYLVNAEEIQIKVAQGAKPGEGGQLPGFKVDEVIARTRHAIPGISLISPPPQHDIYSIEDLAQLIFDLKNVNPTAAVSVKLVAESGVGTVAAGVAKAKADLIVISGAEGGTGASPASSMRFAGISPEIGLSETQQTLVLNGLRSQVRLQTDGQLKTAKDVIIMAMLGADEFAFGTLPLIVLGCMMMRKCNQNTCPMGVATQDPELRSHFSGRADYVVNFFTFLARRVQEYLAEIGVHSLKDIIGRTDLLEVTPAGKASAIDFTRLLHRAGPPLTPPQGRGIRSRVRPEALSSPPLGRGWGWAESPSLGEGLGVGQPLPIHNTDRAVGTMLAGQIAKEHGGAGLPDGTVSLRFKGAAGQSFGAFAVHGMDLRLEGEANDYFGKGLSGGRISILPYAGYGADFVPEDNVIAGNTGLYGATSGELYVCGRVGERFGVRNSGAIAVIEGAGDHCCEYMTGGRVVVLGPTGRNFAAGMSGGVAYVYDPAHTFDYFCNMDMVELNLVEDSTSRKELLELIRQHYLHTGSPQAARMLDNWNDYVDDFVQVVPIEYKRVLLEEKIRTLPPAPPYEGGE